jgi:CelD/BcsL family acetyltransferase involved in cellulose biosynthesis
MSNGVFPLLAEETAPELTISVIRTREDLKAYADRWNELLADSRANSIFLTWQWIDAWLDGVSPQLPLLTVVVSDRAGRLVGIAPFYVSALKLLGGIPFRCLRILGDQDSGAEYPDFILRRNCEASALHAILIALLSRSSAWHCIWLSKMAGWTGTIDLLRRTSEQLGLFMRERPVDFATVDLPDNHAAWLQGLSKNRRGYLRRMTRQLFESHDAQHVCPTRGEDLTELMEALFDLHGKRWRSLGEPGTFVRSPRKKAFYQRMAPRAFKLGWLQMDGLRVDGRIKAILYGYAYNGSIVAIQTGYDPVGFDGIGNVLQYLAIQRAISEGIRQYDLLAGYTQHKEHWRSRRRLGHDVLIGRPCLRNRLLFAKPFWPTGRFLRPERLAMP